MFSKNLIDALVLIYILAVFVGSSQGQYYDDENCYPMGSWCLFNHQCCSKFCIKLGCAECQPDDARCGFNSDCCSGFCVNFRCSECQKVGERCFWASDCCTFTCKGTICAEKTYYG